MAQGEVRQSQLITTYGPGAMVDLPDHSVVIGGLNLWNYGPDKSVEIIDEPRLLAKLRQSLRIKNLQLQKPPINETGPGGLKTKKLYAVDHDGDKMDRSVFKTNFFLSF